MDNAPIYLGWQEWAVLLDNLTVPQVKSLRAMLDRYEKMYRGQEKKIEDLAFLLSEAEIELRKRLTIRAAGLRMTIRDAIREVNYGGAGPDAAPSANR